MTEAAWQRLWVIITGVVTWVDNETGEVEREKLDWATRWALAGIHSYSWRWVRRWGRRACGCTINPITRRRVLTDFDCTRHGFPALTRKDADA